MQSKKMFSAFIQTAALMACLQLIACGKESESRSAGSSSPATAAPTPESTDKSQQDSESQEIFEPGKKQEEQPSNSQSENNKRRLDGSPKDAGMDTHPAPPVPPPSGNNKQFRPAPEGMPPVLTPGEIPKRAGQIPDAPPEEPSQPKQHSVVRKGSQLTGMSYDGKHEYVGTGNDELLGELKGRYARLKGQQFVQARERAEKISRIRMDFNMSTREARAQISIDGYGPIHAFDYSGPVDRPLYPYQKSGPALTLTCSDQNCLVVIGRLDYADGITTSFIYRNLDKKLVFDFLTNESLAEQTYHNWIRLIDSQLNLQSAAVKITQREYAAFEVVYGRSEAYLMLKTNFNEEVDVRVPVVQSRPGMPALVGVRGEIKGLSGAPYLSQNIQKAELVENSGNGNLVIKITTGRSAVDQGEFLISVTDK